MSQREHEHPGAAGFEQSPAASLVTDGPDHLVVAVNAACRELLGGDPVGLRLAQALPAFDEAALSCWSQTRSSGRPRTGHGWRVRTGAPGEDDGVTVDVLLSPWSSPEGGARGVVATLIDTRSFLQEDDGASVEPLATERAGMVTALQEAVLPRDLPIRPRLEVAATYLMAPVDAGVGGDWFDTFAVPDGQVALVVGDVVGRGVDAVAVMVQLRTVLRQRLAAGAGIEEALAATDALTVDLPAAVATTVCVVLVAPGSGELAYVTAGHPPPLVAGADGHATYLPPSGASALGTGSGFTPRAAHLAADELLLLYTDGAVHRPSRSTSQNTLDLSRVVAAAVRAASVAGLERGTVDAVCRATLGRLVGEAACCDDVALLGAARTAAPPTIELALPADPASLRTVRTQLAGWLHELCVRDLDVMALQHAVGELVTNAVEHAYQESPAPQEAAVEVSAVLTEAGDAVVEVRDRGSWREPGSTGRGRGMAMARGLADDVRVRRAEDGTTVTLRHRVSRPVHLFQGHAAPAEPPVPMRAEGRSGGELLVVGDVDQDSAERLRENLLRLTDGGTTAVTVDLSSVSVLGSAGVQVLAEVLAWPGTCLDLVASPGTAAQHVLETVGLPYRAG